MDQSSFHCSWLALGALLKEYFPFCFRHMCHVLTFSVSPIGAGLCSCQQAGIIRSSSLVSQSVRRLLHTNGASNSRLTSSTMRSGFQVFRTMPMHMNWCKTGRNCISQSHIWKLAYSLRTFASSFDGATAMSILGWLRPGWCTPPSWDTKLWCTRLRYRFRDNWPRKRGAVSRSHNLLALDSLDH